MTARVHRSVYASAAAAIFALAAILLAGRALPAGAQGGPTSDKSQIQVLHVQGRVYMLVGAGSNITVQVGDDALVVVDTGVAQRSDSVLAAIRSISQKPILYIINTSVDDDHTGGNRSLSPAGHFVSGLPGEEEGASIVAHLRVLDRMSVTNGKETAARQELWPTDTYDNDQWALFNDEAVIVEHPHAAHTDGDSMVFFRRSDVVSSGDIFTPERYPVIDLQKGGGINGEIDALNRLLDIMVPKLDEEGGTYVIPGHGFLCDRAAVSNYRDMLTIVRDRILDQVKKGTTLEQVEAAKPTMDYDGVYGSETGPWTTQMFVEAVYRDLSKPKSAQGQTAAGAGAKR